MLGDPDAPLLVDVRLEEDFERGHLPGARGNCVLEVAFVDRMRDIAPDREKPVCVCGEGGGSCDTSLAAEKLDRLGYARVFEYRGGLAEWREAGLPLEGHDGSVPERPRVPDGVHAVNLDESRILWTGRNLLNAHKGTIRLSGGSLHIEDGRLAGGEFEIDMRSIRCSDLEGDDLHDVLVRHLMDLDFFDAEKHPQARYVIERVTEPPDGTPGAPNLHIDGQLTLRGTTAPLGFDACGGISPDGQLAAQAVVAFDRTRWGSRYGSGKWFSRLAGHLVNDLVEVELRVVAKPR